MKLLPKLAIAAIAIITSNYVIAATMTSTIPVKGGQALPGTFISISTNQLYDKVAYTLTCTIRNNNINAGEKSDFSLYSGTGTVSIDDKNINIGAATVSHFNSKGSVLKITPVQKTTDNIVIRNLDFTDTISVDNCNAYLIG